jgi:hypothetical protein
MDVYEGAGYKLAYLNQSLKTGSMTESQQKLADKYLEELSGMRSNTILLHLAKYHLNRGEYEDAFICLGKHIENVKSDPKKWQECFDTLDKYETENNAEQINQGRTMLLQKLEHHNQTAIEPIEVTATSN